MDKIAVRKLVVRSFQPAEAIKTLRTNLQFSAENVSVVALTSVNASEGKSTIAFQLAASLAESGKRVLLMDADMRKNTLVSRLGIAGNAVGLSHCLTGLVSVNDALLETDVPGMYVLLAGSKVPNCAELLGGKNFKRIIQGFQSVFDYVIVDCAPLGQVVDCAVIAAEMDGVLMVVDTTDNSYKLERRVKEQLEKAGGKVLGVVLNRVDFSDQKGYYGTPYG